MSIEGPTIATTLHAGSTEVELTPAGDVRAVRADGPGLTRLLVNQYLPTAHDAEAGGLFLRRHRSDGGLDVAVLTGARSTARVEAGDRWVRWTGTAVGARYTVTLVLAPNRWVRRVDLQRDEASSTSQGGHHRDRWDLVAAQDLALAPEAAARNNEAYTSHYLAHQLLEHPQAGTVVATRQTMTCAPALPLAVHAIVEGAQAAVTDGFQLFGPAVRDGATGAALGQPAWTSHRRQYEMAMPTLLGPQLDLSSPSAVHVVGTVLPDYRGDLADALGAVPGLLEDAPALADEVDNAPEVGQSPGNDLAAAGARSLLVTAPRLAVRDLDDDELAALVDGAVREPEHGPDGRLWSGFGDRAEHVVARAKELAVERSHGTVLRAGVDVAPGEGALSTTTYAPSVLASHIAMGNTSAHLVATVHRNALDLLRSAGIRALVRPPGAGDDQWRLLGVPSALVLDVGGTSWVHDSELGRVVASTTMRADAPGLEVTIDADRSLDILLTVGLHTDGWTLETSVDAHRVTMRPAQGSPVAGHYPGLTYVLAAPAGRFGDDGPLLADGRPRDAAMRTVAFDGGWARLVVGADLTNADAASALVDGPTELDRAEHLARHREHLAQLTRHLRVREGRLQELNALVPWFAQNAMVHLLVPHGLEQYGGGAWGTRDVCQGPLEMMLGAGRRDVARTLVVRVLARQTASGELPQWFMPDRYTERYADDAHGDVVVWPLVALARYLEATEDIDVLDEPVPFWDDDARAPSQDAVPAAEHVRATLAYLRTHRAPGTDLISYGHGDWDDTLQPADPELRELMVSSWTVALLANACHRLSEALEGTAYPELATELADEARTAAAGLRDRLIIDGELAGFLFMEHGADGPGIPMLHPQDERTGVHHRLIPVTEAILGGLLSPAQVARHEQMVQRQLQFDDGVRLMDAPASFDEGRMQAFRRAEQSAFFGREVGLMYTHAHLRHVEALTRLGRERTVAELLRVSPVRTHERWPQALPRQRNCYFSSSDAAFDDREQAAAEFDRLREGTVGVRGGWRVYSSGPGIFWRLVVEHLLGVVERPGAVLLDPVLGLEDDGTVLELDVAGAARVLRYHVHADAGPVRVEADGRELTGTWTSEPYRDGGLRLSIEQLTGVEVLDIHLRAGRSSLWRGPIVPDTSSTALGGLGQPPG